MCVCGKGVGVGWGLWVGEGRGGACGRRESVSVRACNYVHVGSLCV